MVIPFFSLPPFSFHLSFAFKRYANVDTLTLQGPFSHVSSTFASVVRINFGTCFSSLNITIRKEHELYYLHLEIKLPLWNFGSCEIAENPLALLISSHPPL